MLKPLALALLLCGSVSAQAETHNTSLTIPCGAIMCSIEFGQVDWTQKYNLYGFTLHHGFVAIDGMQQWDACGVPPKTVAAGGKALREIVGNKPVLCYIHNQMGRSGSRHGSCYINGRQNEILQIGDEMGKKVF